MNTQRHPIETSNIRRYTVNASDQLVMMEMNQSDLGDHNHQFFELTYILGGTARHTLNNVSGTLQKGDYFFVDYGSVHRFENCQGLSLINCLFLPEFIDESLENCRSFATLINACMIRYYRMNVRELWADRIYHDEDGRIGKLLSEMVSEYRDKHIGCTEIYRFKLTEIMILTLRILIQDDKKSTMTTVVTDVMRYVKKNYQKALSLQDFCKEKHYNLSYLSRRFKTETGITFREYVQKIRMEKCCELLEGTDLSVSEIARSVGYEDVQFFHTVFRKVLHMSPREYRKLKKG